MPGPSVPVVAQPPLAEVAPSTAKPAAVGGVWDPENLKASLAEKFPESVRAYHPASDSFVEVAPDAADRAFRAGQIQFHADQEVHVQLADGRVGTVPGSSLGSALDDGARIVSPRQARDAQLERKFAGAKGAAAATGIGFGEGLSAGGTEVGLSAEQAEATSFIRDKHPLAHGLGQGLGVVTGGAILPGGGLGGLAEEGASLATRGLGAGTGFMAKVATKGLAQGARGAAEGVQLAHTEAVSEEALGAPPLSAEKYWASLGDGALFGGLIGGAGGAATEAVGLGARAGLSKLASTLTKATAEDVDAVAAKTFGFVPKGLGDAYVKAASTAAGGGEDIIREAGIQNQSTAARTLRKELLNIDETRDAAAREVRGHVDAMLKGTDAITEEAKGGLKREYIASAVSREKAAETASHSAQTIASARNEIRSMLADADTFGQEKLLGRMDKEFGRYEKRLVDAVKAGDTGEQFALIDDAKRAVGRWTRATKATSIRSASDPITLRQAQATYEKLDGLYESLRGNLENESVWGKAATDQKAINSAWTEQIAADKQFRGALATVVGEERFGGKVYGADPQKVTAYVSGLTNPDKDLVHQAVARYTKATRDLASAVGDSYELPAAKVAEVKKVVAASLAADKTLSEVGEKLAKANQLKALIDAEGHEAGGFLTLAGGLVGGRAGAALGALVEGVARPGKNIMRLAQLEKTLSGFDQKWGGAIKKFLARGTEVPTQAKTGRPLLVARRAKQATRARAVAAAAATEGSAVRQQYARYSEAVKQWQENPAVLQAKIAEHVEAIKDHPKTAAEVPRVAARVAAFLASKLPPMGKSDPIFGTARTPSDAEMSKYNRYVEAATKPETIAEDLERGRVSAEQVEALKECYPQAYEEIRGGMMRELASDPGRRGTFSYQQRVQLGILFDFSAAPSLTKESANHAQAVFSAPPAKAPGKGKPGGGPMPLSRETATPEQKLEQPRT